MSHSSLPDTHIRSAFTALCWNVGTPVAYRAQLAMEREDWLHLATIKVSISHYTCARTLSGDLQIAAFWKKYQGFNLGLDLEALAIESFWTSERQCFTSNERLSPLLFDLGHYGEGVRKFFTCVRKEMRAILGRCPEPSELNARFGPRSTFGDVGARVSVPDKMSNDYTLTQRAEPFLGAWATTAWARNASFGLQPLQHCAHVAQNVTLDPSGALLTQNHIDCTYAVRHPYFVRGNRFTTVPKESLKLRGICVEPSLNVYYQLGVGDWISRRMKMVLGWIKETREGFHKLLARLGSLTGLNATIDLQNASDTLCTNLVKLCAPPRWFDLLNSLRCHFTWLPGKERKKDGHWVKLEKFSSMGNGFTFELETLIFYCIAKVMSCGTCVTDWLGDVVTVYGDDIIVPVDRAKDVLSALSFVGFTPNKSKTFLEGDFRESCGGDFWRGLDVRPHYQKELLNEPHQRIALANGLRRFGIRHINCGGPNVHVVPWKRVLDTLPSQIRDCRGPEALGDLVIHDDEVRWRTKVRGSIRYFRCWRPILFRRTDWSHFRPGVVLASALYGVGDGRTADVPGLSPHLVREEGVLTQINGSYVSGYRFGRVAFS